MICKWWYVKDGLHSWFSNLEQHGFEYSLPKTGVDDKNGKFHFKNLYSHNPNLFRWKGESDKWISLDELRNLFLINYLGPYYNFEIIKQGWFWETIKRSEQKQSGVVEVVTTTFDESRTSYPVEFFYDKVACEAGCTEDLAECIIQCQTDNACISDCNRAFSDCLNSFC